MIRIPCPHYFVKRVDKIVGVYYNVTSNYLGKGSVTMRNPIDQGKYPVFFRKNRVFRVYLGGKLLDEFIGEEGSDGNYPEEWICSAVRAINPGHTDPLEGISLREEDGMPFDVLLKKHKEAYLGQREDLGVLVKFLDSAIRLPMQVHPTRAFSRANFQSPYGKAESWLILDTREDACIYFGFKDQISKADFEKLVERSRMERECMTAVVNRIPVKAGDVFFVDAGVIHAIGAGCLILEVQEPTDFTVQPEHWCGDYKLNDREMYLGLDPSRALDCFHYGLYGQEVLKSGKKIPKQEYRDDRLLVETLIGEADTPCFSVKRFTVNGGSFSLSIPASIWVCTDGEGVLTGEGYEKQIKKGDYFFLPAAAAGSIQAASTAALTLVACVPGQN